MENSLDQLIASRSWKYEKIFRYRPGILIQGGWSFLGVLPGQDVEMRAGFNCLMDVIPEVDQFQAFQVQVLNTPCKKH